MRVLFNLLFFIFGFVTCASASVNRGTFNPGYLGKKTVISASYTPYFRIGVNNILSENPIMNYSSRLRNNININLERAISKTISFNLQYGISNFNAKYGPFSQDVFEKDGTATFYGQKYISAKVASSDFSIGMKIYNQNKGAIAPLGNYFHIFYGKSTVNIKSLSLFAPAQTDADKFSDYFKIPNHDEAYSYNYPYLGVGFGKNRILYDKLLLGIEISASFKLKYKVNLKGVEGYSINDNDIFYSFSREINRQSTIGITFKAGYVF